MKPFEHVVVEHAATVLRVCRAVLGSADAEDAWSETFLSALKAYPELDPGANIEAWLVTIAHRKAIDIRRAQARHAVPVADLPERPVAQHDSTDRDGDLRDALDALPPKQRLTVTYHYLGGLTHRQIAGIVGGSEAAARRSAADGIATLRRTYLTKDTKR